MENEEKKDMENLGEQKEDMEKPEETKEMKNREIKVLDASCVRMIKTSDVRVIGEMIKDGLIVQEDLENKTSYELREPVVENSEVVTIKVQYFDEMLKLIKRAKLKEVEVLRLHVKKDNPILIEAVDVRNDKVVVSMWVAPWIKE